MIIAINLKNYKQGKEVMQLVGKIEKHLKNAVVCVPAFDLMTVVGNSKLDVFAQHVDYMDDNRSTGFLLVNAAKSAGAAGTLVNHSEHKLFLSHIKRIIEQCKKHGLKEIVCIGNFDNLYDIMKMEPWAIAYEDPELISSGKSVTKYNPESIKNFVARMKDHGKKSKILCGAGISSAEDVLAAKDLGCEGVLVASAIANAKNPDKILKEIARAIKKQD